MTPQKEAALDFLLKAVHRKRRNPFLRYLFPDFTVAHIGLIALSIMILFGGFVVAPNAGGIVFLLAAVPAVFVWYRSSFRTKFDERREFIQKAEKIGVSEISAGEFYDTHAKRGTLI